MKSRALKDLLFSLITGFTTGIIAWRIFKFLNVPSPMNISYFWLVFIIPALWILGVNLGYFLGRWFGFFSQFGKFAAIGFTNAAVDFGILNLLIALTLATSGYVYSVFKSISFVIAVTHSYFWNKYWSFDAGKSGGGGLEFAKFFAVMVVSFIINVGVATFIVNFITPIYGLSPEIWANVGAGIGSAAALIFSFLGFKIIVFKK